MERQLNLPDYEALQSIQFQADMQKLQLHMQEKQWN